MSGTGWRSAWGRLLDDAIGLTFIRIQITASSRRVRNAPRWAVAARALAVQNHVGVADAVLAIRSHLHRERTMALVLLGAKDSRSKQGDEQHFGFQVWF